MTMRRFFGLLLLGAMVLLARPAAAQQVIFLVRHAERAPSAPPQAPAPAAQPGAKADAKPHGMMMPDDPPLSPAGEQRAARLAAMLASSGVQQIYTTEFKRTRQTAAPLAERLKLKAVMSAASDPDPLVQALQKGTAPALVVGHSNTIPDLIKKLGVTEAVAIGDNDYDNLFVVVRSAAGKATLIRLKY
jgi:phosphohistidine phosphatase SixA